MRLSLVLAASLAVCVFAAAEAATSEIPAPDALILQIEKMSKTMTIEEKHCTDEISEYKAEIARRQLKITRNEQTIKKIKEKRSFSKSQLKSESSAIAKVKEMILAAMNGGTSPSSAQVASTQAEIQNLQKNGASKMAGVLTNIVSSVGSSNLEYNEILKLLGTLEKRLAKAIGSDPITAEWQIYQEKNTVEQGNIEEIQHKLTVTEASCVRRKSEWSEVLSVLKVIRVKMENVTIPDCSAGLKAKDELHKTCLQQVSDLKSKELEYERELEKCEKVHGQHDECTKELEKCVGEKGDLTVKVEELSHFKTEVEEYKKQVEELTKEITSCNSHTATLQAEIESVKEALAKSEEAAKCTEFKTEITKIDHHVEELNVKVELGDKCAANYKQLTLEKSELIQHLEKMATVHKQLETCHFDMSKLGKECQAATLEAAQSHQQSIEKLTEHLKTCQDDSAKLAEAAKCTNEKVVIEKYEKEVVTIKTETKTVVTQIESEIKGCHAALTESKEYGKKESDEVSKCKERAESCESQLQVTKIDHSNCVDTHTMQTKACSRIAADLTQVKMELSKEVNKTTHLMHIRQDLIESGKELHEEVTKLEYEEKHLKEELAKLTEAMKDEEEKVVVLTKKVETLTIEEEKLVKEKTTISHHLEVTTTKLEHTVTTVTKLETSLKTSNEDTTELKAELKKLYSTKEELTQSKIELEGEVKKLEVELKTQHDYRVNAEKELGEAKTSMDAGSNKINELTNSLVKINAEKTSIANQLTEAKSQIEALESDLKSCEHHLEGQAHELAHTKEDLEHALEAAKCVHQKAETSETKKQNRVLKVENKGLQHSKSALEKDLVTVKSKLTTWQAFNTKLTGELKQCTHGHVGCKSSVHHLKNQMMKHLRALKGHVSNVARLEEALAASQVETMHTRKQWHKDRKAYKTFKDNLLENMAKLIALAKDAKHKFDVARAAMRNELKVQDAQWGVCRKEVLNYERMLGSGVVKAEKEKLRLYEATQKYVRMKASAEMSIQKATSLTKTAAAKKAAMLKAQNKLAKIYKKVSNKANESAETEDVQTDAAPSDSDAKLLTQLKENMKLD